MTMCTIEQDVTTTKLRGEKKGAEKTIQILCTPPSFVAALTSTIAELSLVYCSTNQLHTTHNGQMTTIIALAL